MTCPRYRTQFFSHTDRSYACFSGSVDDSVHIWPSAARLTQNCWSSSEIDKTNYGVWNYPSLRYRPSGALLFRPRSKGYVDGRSFIRE
jgi:hypothetical protein